MLIGSDLRAMQPAFSIHVFCENIENTMPADVRSNTEGQTQQNRPCSGQPQLTE